MNGSIKKYQLVITIMILLLGLGGIISIAIGCHSFSRPFDLVWKQFFRLVAGLLLIRILAAIPFDKLKKSFPWCAAAFLIPLYILLKYGVKINGMRGWFRFETISFQPSEPGKAFFLAGLILLINSKRIKNMTQPMQIAASSIYTVVWLAAVLLQPDMGTATVYGASFIIILYFSGIKWQYLSGLLLSGAAAAAVFILKHPYAMRRIDGFLNPDHDPLGRGWHLRQLLRAVSRGSWFGVKSANATWSQSYLPFAYNDSVFATITETLGMVGASLIPLAFLTIGIMLIRLAEKNRLEECASLYVKGAAFMIVFQSFLHMSVNLGILPMTGITMVFVSYGGSSMISGALLIGIAFSALNTVQTRK